VPMIAKNIEALIGDTPLLEIKSLSLKSGATILAKCEFMNPSSSVKDRIASFMITKALENKEITPQTTLIEPTSGNTGVGLASVCASRGLKLILTMPESMSIERQKLLKHLGATLILTPANEGMQGAIERAYALEKELDNAKVLQQFNNPHNPEAHYQSTAKELLRDTQEKIDFFVASVGTGGTFTGTTRGLKERLPSLQAIAVEPENSAVIAGKEAGVHAIQGIGAGFIPEIFDRTLCDGCVSVPDEEAFEMAREIAKTEGLLVGISSGANLYATLLLASKPQNRGKVFVTILCDTAERYLSTPLFEEA